MTTCNKLKKNSFFYLVLLFSLFSFVSSLYVYIYKGKVARFYVKKKSNNDKKIL
jgi:hypothetical protein